jgi:hypothetical protein
MTRAMPSVAPDAAPPVARPATGRRHGFGPLAWALSLIVHSATIVALCWTVPPAVRRSLGESCVFLRASYAYLPAADTELAPVRPASFEVDAIAAMTPAFWSDARPQSEDPVPLAGASSAQTAPPAAEDREPATQLFGIGAKGRRIVYVFDRSASMEGYPLQAAKRELLASVQQLGGTHQFQVIFYNHQPLCLPLSRAPAGKLALADEQGRRLAEAFIGGIYADGPTDHLPALQAALSLRPDVIFLLTDADEPQLAADELRLIRKVNAGAAIHTIEFGSGPPPLNENFLRQLARENRGQHRYVDLAELR